MKRMFGVLVSCSLVILVAIIFLPVTLQLQPRLRENDTCITSEGHEGICKILAQCPKGIESIQSGGRPKTCGFTDDSLIICCPQDQPRDGVVPLKSSPKDVEDNAAEYAAAVKKAKEKCEEYGKTVKVEIASPILVISAAGSQTIDTCARLEEPLVVGGVNAKPKEFPHMALIGYGEREVSWLCGGTLISERFILSAAHCSRSASIGEAKWAKVGELDTSTDMEDALPDVYRIVERFVYPKYNRDFLYNDIALFKLEFDVEISAYVRPLCLFTSMELPQNEVIATGWGHTSWDDASSSLRININGTEEEDVQDPEASDPKEKQSDIEYESGTASSSLMKVKLAMVSSKTCDEKYKPSRGKKLAQGILEESQLCAGDEAGKDTCQGDSGGPLQIPLKEPYCMYAIVGVTSFGKSCGTGYPGVYTRVSHFLPWIVKTVWTDQAEDDKL